MCRYFFSNSNVSLPIISFKMLNVNHQEATVMFLRLHSPCEKDLDTHNKDTDQPAHMRRVDLYLCCPLM